MKVKRINKKRLTIAIIILLLLLLGITIGLYYLINKNDKPVEHLIYDEFETIGGKINETTYYLLGANNDISFDIVKEDNFSYQVTDSEENKIDSQLIGDKIKGPATLYEEGKTYHLKINNGKFKDEKYTSIKEIIFKINRPAKQEMVLIDNVIKKNINDIEITEKDIKLDGEHEENSIVVVYDGEKLVSAYKIGKKENDKYTYTIPKMEEVFKDIDYYGKERINLADYQNDKSINLLVASLIPTVYAKEDVTIAKPVWNKKDGTLEVGVTIYTTEKKEFLPNHDAKIELTLILSVDLYKDIALNDINYATVINYDIKIKNNLNYANDDYTKLFETIKLKNNIENYDTSWLEKSYNGLDTDKKQINKSFGKLTVETEIPGLYLDIQLGTLIDINSKGYTNTLLTGKNSFLVGINNNKEIYSTYTFDNKGELNFIGDEDNKIASSINTNLSFMNLFNMNTKMISGMYTNGKSVMKVNNDDKKQTIIDYEINGDGGFFAKYLVTLEKDSTIYDDKISLTKYEKKAIISSKVKEEEKKEEEKEKPTYKYTKEEIREMLQSGYDELDALEAWVTPMGTLTTMVISQKTIDVNNNTFTGTWTYDDNVSYSCTYNYVTKDMSCEGFSVAQNYVKGTCDNTHEDYLNYLETGEIQNDDAKEWDNLYTDMDSCYYEAISKNEPTNFNEDIQNILTKKELTFEDLGVLST